MRVLSLALAALTLLGCKERRAKAPVPASPSVTQSADAFREDLIRFSEDAAGIPPKRAPDTTVALNAPRVPQARRHPSTKPRPAEPEPVVHATEYDSLSMARPFTEAEVARYVEEHYRAATAQLLTDDPHFESTVEEALVYSRDGAFPYLKARRALARGRLEDALVQAELAAKRGSRLDPDTKKNASLLRCEALDSIRKLRPSEEAQAAAAKAWQSHNLVYSPN